MMPRHEDIELALERWAEEYNEEFGLRDAKRIMRRRLFMNTVGNWLIKTERTNKQGELNVSGFPLSDFDRDLQWLPHSHNPDRTLELSINYAIAVELSGQKHTGMTRRAVNGLKDRILSCICGQSLDTLSNKESEKIRSWEQWLEDNKHIPAVKTVLKRRAKDAKA
jgi:predicted MPP superfamily phosphohydrolase